jgi:hypothetical protein
MAKQFYNRFKIIFIFGRVVDPDWIRIQGLCGSGSVLGIRILIQGQENEEISVEKCTL